MTLQPRYERGRSCAVRPPQRRKKSRLGRALDDIKYGNWHGAVNTMVGRHRARSADSYYGEHRSRRHDYPSRSRSSSRFRDYPSRSRSRNTVSRHQDHELLRQAATSAAVAGAVEAFRIRNKPGLWTGSKGARVATAALSAAGIDGVIDSNPDRKTKRHVVEAVLGGLVTNRLVNGPRWKREY